MSGELACVQQPEFPPQRPPSGRSGKSASTSSQTGQAASSSGSGPETAGSLKESRQQSFSNMFDGLLGRAQNARDFSETAVGLKQKTEVVGGASIGPAGLLVYQSPLSQAAKSGSAAAVESLLKAGVDPNSGSSVLHGLLAAYSSLSESAVKGDVQTVEALLKAGADPNLGTRYGPFGLCSQFTPLAAAANGGHTDTVHALVKAGADANSGVHIGPVGPLIAQYTPLGRACRNGHTETMLVLLEAGADPNVGLSLGPFGTIGTYSLLGHAAAHGNTEAVRALLKAGADANQGLCFGPLGALASFSPLEHAARNGHTECVKALLESGADPDRGFAVGPFGILAHANPLVHAAANGHSEAVNALITAGAAPGGVYPWSHLDPAKGCAQRSVSEPGDSSDGAPPPLRRSTSISVSDKAGQRVTIEISPERIMVDELQEKVAEKEQALEVLIAEQRALQRQLTAERRLSAALKDDLSSGGESPTRSVDSRENPRRRSAGGDMSANRSDALRSEGPRNPRRNSLGPPPPAPNFGGDSAGEGDRAGGGGAQGQLGERPEGFGSPPPDADAPAKPQAAMRDELGAL